MVNRRKFFWRLATTLLFAVIRHPTERAQATTINPSESIPPSESTTASAITNEPLRDRAARKGLLFGTFLAFNSYDEFANNKAVQTAIIRECNLVVGGFYWGSTRPSERTFNLNSADQYIQFAANHQLLFRGHPLLWHEANPQWLIDQLKSPSIKPDNIRTLLTNHIDTIVRRYAGHVHSWDVVNEAIEPGDQRDDGLRLTPWLNALGPDYIEIAFRTAAAADPQAMLVYNDNGLEYDTPYHDSRRAGVLSLLTRLIAKGVPVHALGIQAHLNHVDEKGQKRSFNPTKLRQFLQDVANLGLKILITELDVTDQYLPADVKERDRLVANTYREFLTPVLDNPAVIAVITWGLSDNQSWLSNFAPRRDGLAVRPLPFDANLNPKLAWTAIAQALDQAPRR